MKRLCFLFVLFVGCIAHTYAQVGINTTSPFATLDVTKEPSGTVADGIIAPNLDLSELIARNALYGANQSGSFVYVTAIDATPAGKTRNVVTEGYYYFDGTEWKHFNDKLQTADNGLSVGTTANVQLGGDLTQNTQINTKGNKLSIIGTGTDTGLQLATGGASGKVLTSDASGNAVWVSGATQYQTSVYGSAFGAIIDNATFPNFVKITTLKGILFDTAKLIYGSLYGWDSTNQRYIAPVEGIYRITVQVYFGGGDLGQNMRAYLFKNGGQFLDPGIISVTDAGADQAGDVMGLAKLNKGDILDLRISAQPNGSMTYYSAIGHTFLIIEAL